MLVVMDSTDISTALGGSDTSAFSESTSLSLGIKQEKHRRKTGKKKPRTKKFDALLDQLDDDGFLTGEMLSEVLNISDNAGTEVDVTLRTVGSATEPTVFSHPPANSAVRSNAVLDKCNLEKSVKKNSVAGSDLKSKPVGKTPVTTFAGIFKRNDNLLEDDGDIQHHSSDTNVESVPSLQKKKKTDSHLSGKNKKQKIVSSDGVTSTVAADLHFKDASVQAEASHSDASVQVDLCQCGNYLQSPGSCTTRGKALDHHEDLMDTLKGTSMDAVAKQLYHHSSFSDSPVKGSSSSTPFSRPSLYESAVESLPASSVTSGSTPSMIVHNISLQVSMSADELSYCGNERDSKAADLGKEIPTAGNSDSNDASAPMEISNNTHKLDSARTLFGLTDDEESPDKSNLVCGDGRSTNRNPSFSGEADGQATRREVLQSTFLDRGDQAAGLPPSELSFVAESPTELATERHRKSRGWKRVSMCAMNFMERRGRNSWNDSDQQTPGSLSVVPDSDESFVTPEDPHEDTAAAAAKALKSTPLALESESSDDEFEKFLTCSKAVRKERRSIISMSKFIVDECEEEDNLDTDDDVEEETESDRDDDDDDDDNDGDGRKAIVISSDEEVFNDKVSDKNNQGHDVVKELSERLKKSLISSDDDDDFSSIYYSTKKEIGKKSILPKSSTVKDSKEKSVEPARTLKFRTPGAFVSSRDRVVSVVTPPHGPSPVDLGLLPHTVGHAAPVRCGFLSSLDPQMKQHLRDLNAARFINGFKSLRIELTAKLFSLYNERVFDMKIPSDTKVVWNDRMRTTAGWCSYRTTKEATPKRYVQIELSVKVCNSPDRVRDTLIHEMCHAKVWIEYGVKECHGRLWKSWAQIANNALPELPRITVYHNYTISTKYIYRCTRCGSRVGRHSKSLDIEKFFCKFCFGQFELLVQSETGGAENVFKTPRPPNQFAKFVKENYSEVKKTTPGFTHSEIMKLIGQRYSAKKSASCLGGGQKLDFSD